MLVESREKMCKCVRLPIGFGSTVRRIHGTIGWKLGAGLRISAGRLRLAVLIGRTVTAVAALLLAGVRRACTRFVRLAVIFAVSIFYTRFSRRSGWPVFRAFCVFLGVFFFKHKYIYRRLANGWLFTQNKSGLKTNEKQMEQRKIRASPFSGSFPFVQNA